MKSVNMIYEKINSSNLTQGDIVYLSDYMKANLSSNMDLIGMIIVSNSCDLIKGKSNSIEYVAFCPIISLKSHVEQIVKVSHNC